LDFDVSKCGMSGQAACEVNMRSERSNAFRVRDGVVCEGGDPILSLLENPERERLRTFELADGWYQFDTADCITRPLAHGPPGEHAHPRKSSRLLTASYL
jgi:hypothetical protein